MRGKVFRGIREQLRNQVLQGRDIHGLALAPSLGIVLGIIPLLGVSTALCALLAVLLRLNHLLIQAANYLVYPLQLILIFPFIRLGEHITGISVLPDSFDQMQAHFRLEGAAALLDYLSAALLGLFAWLLLGIPLGFLIYFSLRRSLPKISSKQPRDAQRG
jgi:uncharacterized protein (DUF2062 family)